MGTGITARQIFGERRKGLGTWGSESGGMAVGIRGRIEESGPRGPGNGMRPADWEPGEMGDPGETGESSDRE